MQMRKHRLIKSRKIKRMKIRSDSWRSKNRTKPTRSNLRWKRKIKLTMLRKYALR